MQFLFFEDIHNEALLANFNMLTIVPYKGKTDLTENVGAFNNHMNLLIVTDHACYKCFAVTFTNQANKWFRKLLASLISSLAHLKVHKAVIGCSFVSYSMHNFCQHKASST